MRLLPVGIDKLRGPAGSHPQCNRQDRVERFNQAGTRGLRATGEYPVAVAGTTGQMVVSSHLYHPNPLHRDHDIKSATIVVNRAAAFDYAG